MVAVVGVVAWVVLSIPIALVIGRVVARSDANEAAQRRRSEADGGPLTRSR